MEKKRGELVQQLRKMIAEPGRFPDSKLPSERELAQSLGVSRNLLREAVITLEALGYLEVRERQGTFITAPAADDFVASLRFASLWPEEMLCQLMEMRLVIEVPIAGLAALRRSDEEVKAMRRCIADLEQASLRPDGGASEGAQWDSRLHMLIVNAARNPLLSRLYEGLAATMERYISMSRIILLAIDGWPAKIVAEHEALVEAIAHQDPQGAEEAQRHHLGSALEALKALTKKN